MDFNETFYNDEGIRNRPEPDTETGRVWTIASQLLQEYGDFPSRAEVIEICELNDISPATASTQFGAWQKHMRVI